MKLTSGRIAIAASLFAGVNALLFAADAGGTRSRGVLFHSVGVTTARIPLSVRILEPDGTPARNLRIVCIGGLRGGTITMTNRHGQAECSVPVTSEKEYYGIFCVRQTYNTHDVEVFETRPDGSRQMLEPVKFTRTGRSMAVVCRRSEKL